VTNRLKLRMAAISDVGQRLATAWTGVRCGCPHTDGGRPNRKTLASAISRAASRREDSSIVTVTVTPRRPAAAAHAFSSPTVREIPPVQRPGTFDSTW
jgi:hypothetical protein